MSETQAQNYLILTLAKGRLAELRKLAKDCQDEDTGREIYRETLQIAVELNNRYKFSLQKDKRTVK